MRSRKVKDYFTSCLPWPQKGTASFINDIGDLGVETHLHREDGHRMEGMANIHGHGLTSGYLQHDNYNGGYGKVEWVYDPAQTSGSSPRWLNYTSGVDKDGLTAVSTITGSVHTTVNALREARL
jgi:hypothetical protein